jgi:UDP-glucose 4-epimerase
MTTSSNADRSHRVVVTGGLGAMGRYVVPELEALGAEVVVADLVSATAPASSMAVQSADVTDLDSITRIVADTRPAAILHLAAKVARNDEEPLQSIRLNCIGTWNVLEAARQHAVPRVVSVSTRGTYGSFEGRHGSPDYEPTPESYRCAPTGLYGASKLAAEYVVKSFRSQHGLDAVSTRQAWTYGPGKVGVHGVYGIYSSVVEGILSGEPIKIARGGDQANDVIYNGDVATALALLVMHPQPLLYDTYNIGTGRGVTLREFAHQAQSQLGAADTAPPDIGAGMGFEGFNPLGFGVLDITRISNETGWQPRSLPETLDDYRTRFAAHP